MVSFFIILWQKYLQFLLLQDFSTILLVKLLLNFSWRLLRKVRNNILNKNFVKVKEKSPEILALIERFVWAHPDLSGLRVAKAGQNVEKKQNRLAYKFKKISRTYWWFPNEFWCLENGKDCQILARLKSEKSLNQSVK